MTNYGRSRIDPRLQEGAGTSMGADSAGVRAANRRPTGSNRPGTEDFEIGERPVIEVTRRREGSTTAMPESLASNAAEVGR